MPDRHVRMEPTRRDRQAARWAARLTGAAAPLSPAERRALESWCGAEPGNAAALDRFGQLWDDPAFQAAARAAALPGTAAPGLGRRRLLAAGGAGLALGLAGWLGRAPLQRALADAATAPGEIRALPPLAGGGQLLLDTASAVGLEDGGGVRLLAGALRLDLPAAAAPLRLAGGRMQGQVAPGSILSLRRQAGEDRLSVLRGQVLAADGALGAGTGGLWTAAGRRPDHALSLAETDAVEGFAQAWRLFAAAPLAEVAEELARYMPGSVLVADGIAGLRVAGRFRFATPDAVLAVLAQTLPLRVQHYGRLLTRLTGTA
jgi:ferric-dicitrate binding protein FerR (iron transport regulator)